jgi:hypothetical protein
VRFNYWVSRVERPPGVILDSRFRGNDHFRHAREGGHLGRHHHFLKTETQPIDVIARGDWRWSKKAPPDAKQSRAAPDADRLDVKALAAALEVHDLKPAFHLYPGGHDRAYWRALTVEYLAFYAVGW